MRTLKVDDRIIFERPRGPKLIHRVCKSMASGDLYCRVEGYPNDILFDELGIKDRFAFCNSYYNCTSSSRTYWPECPSSCPQGMSALIQNLERKARAQGWDVTYEWEEPKDVAIDDFAWSGGSSTSTPKGLDHRITYKYYVDKTMESLNDQMRYFYSTIKPYDLKLTQPKPTFMNKVTSMMKRLMDVDTQTLYKAGFINTELELTDAGRRALWGICFQDNKAELVKLAEERIAEEKAERDE